VETNKRLEAEYLNKELDPSWTFETLPKPSVCREIFDLLSQKLFKNTHFPIWDLNETKRTLEFSVKVSWTRLP